MSDIHPDAPAVAALAAANGLAVDPATITFNEIGLDFRIAFATDRSGQRWVLRLPRRPDVLPRARVEAKALAVIAPRLPVAVPDWQIVSDDLIAYPMLAGEPGLTFDPQTHAVTWHFDQTSPLFPQTLGAAIQALHAIPADDLRATGVPVFLPDEVRAQWATDLDRVRAHFEVKEEQWASWQAWLADDACWPTFTVPIHGDLYAGHVMVDADGRATGVIDWTEIRIGDPAVDLVGHARAFGEAALPALIRAYREAGGRTWPGLEAQCRHLNSATGVRYALYALATGDEAHRAAAQAQLMA